MSPSSENLLLSLLRQRFGYPERISLRRVAREVDIDAGSLLRILDGERALSLPQALHLATKLELPQEAREALVVATLANRLTRAIAEAQDGLGPDEAPRLISKALAKVRKSVLEPGRDAAQDEETKIKSPRA